MRGTILALALLTAAVALPAQNLTGVKAIAASGNSSFALLSDGTVWWWGEDSVWDEAFGGGLTTPVRVSGLTDVVAVSPPLALKADGTVWAYSLDSGYPFTPFRVDGLTGVVAVAGGLSSLALKSDGTVWAVGHTVTHNGTVVWPAATPVSGLTEVMAIAMGSRHSLALKRDGTVWEWGDNNNGLPGDGLTLAPYSGPWPDPSTPAQVSGLTDVVAVAAGYGHSLALKSDGTVWAWGFNGHGQLGDGTTETRTTPFQVNGLAGVVKIAAGDAHSVAVKSDGTVWAWGSNVGGQLGDGTTTDRLEPVQVSGLSGTAVAAGRFHNLALKDDGTVWAWGDDQFGQLGDGGEVQPGPLEAQLGPLQVSGLTEVTKIAAGFTHSLALKADGTLWAWGDNSVGELGDGTTRARDWPDRSTPVKVSGLAGVTAIAGGDLLSLAVTGDGAVWAWGLNAGIKDGMPTDASTPVQVSGLSGVVSVTPGVSLELNFSGDLSPYWETYSYYHLAVRDDGSLWKWSLPRPGDPIPAGPVPMAELSDVRMAAASVNQNLALKRDGTVWEWGPGQPWSGATEPRPTPSQVSGLTDVVAAAAENYYSLALKRDGTVWAWGDNSSGQLGDGTRTDRATPVQVAGLSDVAAIDTRRSEGFLGTYPHSVALKNDGTVWEWPIWEWPIDWRGGPKSLTPVQVAGLTDIVAVAEGGGHSLALKRDGTVWAWGQNVLGQLGVRTFAIRTTPVQVVGPATQ
jgi:alpha-tubulin suppressor-like RCC1 family protein